MLSTYNGKSNNSGTMLSNLGDNTLAFSQSQSTWMPNPNWQNIWIRYVHESMIRFQIWQIFTNWQQLDKENSDLYSDICYKLSMKKWWHFDLNPLPLIFICLYPLNFSSILLPFPYRRSWTCRKTCHLPIEEVGLVEKPLN